MPSSMAHDNNGPPPGALPGWTSVRLDVYGTGIRLAGALMVFPLIAESQFGVWYTITFASLGFGGLAFGLALTIWSDCKSRREINAGYTPSADIAAEHSELFWTDAYLRGFRPPGDATKIREQVQRKLGVSGDIPVRNERPTVERPRRCTRSGCDRYFVVVYDRVCGACGSSTQHIPEEEGHAVRALSEDDSTSNPS